MGATASASTAIRQRVVDDAAGRQALHGRFLFAQIFLQNDPWAERAAAARSTNSRPGRR